jgi:hypothetical protein
MGDVDVDALEVVGAGSADGDLIIHAKLLLSDRMGRNASPRRFCSSLGAPATLETTYIQRG